MMIIEIIPFNFEVLTLEIKFQTHWAYVDKFIVYESNLDYRGRDKKFYSEDYLDFFKKYSKKVQLVKIEIPDNESGKNMSSINYNKFEVKIKNRFNEFFIENFKLKDSDIILMTDCDEVISPKFLKKIKTGEKLIKNQELILLKNYSNKLNLHIPIKLDLNFKVGGEIARNYLHKHFITISTFSYFKENGYVKCSKQIRDLLIRSEGSNYNSTQGWHFQNIMSPEDFVNKKYSSMLFYSGKSNDDFDTRASNLEEAHFRYRNNLPLSYEFSYSSGEPFSLQVDSLEDMPPYVKNNVDKFKEWIAF